MSDTSEKIKSVAEHAKAAAKEHAAETRQRMTQDAAKAKGKIADAPRRSRPTKSDA